MILLSIVLPWNIAFEGDELVDPLVFDLIVDISFIIDIVLIFNTAYYESVDDTTVLVTNRKQIAKNYMRSWFWLDIVASLPIDLIVRSSVNQIAKIVRMQRLQKLFRLIKIPRLFKLLSLNNRLKTSFSLYKDNMKQGSVTMVLSVLGIFCHVAACSWVVIAHINLTVMTPTWIEVEELVTASSIDVYVASLYFIVMTMTTVGYGDISSNNLHEYLLNIFLKLAGVVLFSFVQSYILKLI